MPNGLSPLVSAIIPVYNGATFIAETIKSVLEQTYPNIECIVINDGSTDDTAAVVKSFGNRVHYIEKQNGGVSSARNVGIEAANGEFIAFLDADDLWLPEKIEKQIELAEKNPDAGLIYSSVNIIDKDGDTIDRVELDNEGDELARILLLEKPVYLTMTGLVPKHVFKVVGDFDERLSTSADGEMAVRIALKYPLKQISTPLAAYRQHGNQMHLNLAAFDRDMKIIYEEFFAREDLALEIRSIRSKCYAILNLTLAIGHLRIHGDYYRALKYSSFAMLNNAIYTITRYRRIMKSRKRDR